MKRSGEGTNSAAFSLLDSHESGPHERFNVAADGKSSARGLRLIVSCGDTGLAKDYLCFLNENSAQSEAGATYDLLSPEILLQKIARSEVRPVEVVFFSTGGFLAR